MMRRTALVFALLAAVPAAATPLEDRLREQLQSTTSQLRAAQGQQASLEAAKAAAEAERDALKAKPRTDPAAARELAAARSQASTLRGELDSGKAALAEADRRATDAVARATRAETELAQIKASSSAASSAQAMALKQCVDANGRLVTTGRDLVALHIKRYGKHDFGPLQLQRTKIENEAQAMADRVNADAIMLNAAPAPPK